MAEKSEFYTLNGYKRQHNYHVTEAMEDYLEMLYRITDGKNRMRIKDLAHELNVKPSSTSKMISRLKEKELVDFEKYGDINLTEKGITLGKFFLWRHNVLVDFFKLLNKEDYSLEQVEKIEHFIDLSTLYNMEKMIKKDID